MNVKRLRIYLDDHLALLVGESQLAGRVRRSNTGSTLEAFLAELEAELEEQKRELEHVIERLLGAGGGRSLKQSAAWFAEKLGRLKLNDSLVRYSPLSRLLELQALAAAAQERVALWQSLETLADNPALVDCDFTALRTIAEDRRQRLLSHCREAADEAFGAREE